MRGFFKGLGAEISAERSDKGIEDDLHKIIGVCEACFKDNVNVNQIEEVLNGIVSMLALVRNQKHQQEKNERLHRLLRNKIGNRKYDHFVFMKLPE